MLASPYGPWFQGWLDRVVMDPGSASICSMAKGKLYGIPPTALYGAFPTAL